MGDSVNSGSPQAIGSKTDSSNTPVPGISAKTWDKFQQLQKRREEQSRRSTLRRIEEIKADVVAKIREHFSNDDEAESLQRHDVDLSQLDSKSTRRKRKRPANAIINQCAGADSTDADVSTNSEPCAENLVLQSEWLEVKQHLNVNSHLTDETGGSEAPKCHLEKAVNIAIAAAEFDLAEKLSDRLANRDFGSKISAAFDAKRFIDQRKCEEDARKANKKKKLAWGFEHKQRWETKGNM